MNSKELKMVTEISKIITNTIKSKGGIELSPIGTVVKMGDSFQLIDGGSYPSLSAVLAEMEGVSSEQAKALYSRWLELMTLEDGAYTIDMIGTVSGGVLTVEQKLFSKLRVTEDDVEEQEEEFEEQIVDEPVVEEPIVKRSVAKPAKAKRESSQSKTWYLLAALIVVVVAVGAIFMIETPSQTQIVAEQVEPVVEPKVEVVEVPVVEPVAEPVVEPVAATPLYTERGAEPALRTFRGRTASSDKALMAFVEAVERSTEVANKRYHVVLGAYTSQANAGRLIIDFGEFFKDRSIPTYVATYGKSTVVSLFASDNKAECEEYVSTIGNKLTSTLWVCRRE